MTAKTAPRPWKSGFCVTSNPPDSHARCAEHPHRNGKLCACDCHTTTDQAELHIPGLPPITIEPTTAMLDGRQTVFQCAHCGCVVVQPQPADHHLGLCPSCADSKSTWWHQRLPVAGLRETT